MVERLKNFDWQLTIHNDPTINSIINIAIIIIVKRTSIVRII